MTKYPLTPKQQEILRAIADGLRNESIETTWLYARAMGDTYTDLTGFERAQELQMKESDLRTFADLGFISHPEQRRNCVAYHVNEQEIFNAVNNNFEKDNPAANPSTVQNITIGSIANSNVNIGIKLDQINQKIHTSTSLPEDNKTELTKQIEALKAELEKLQTTNPKEAQTLTKQLDRVVDDMAEDPPDAEGVKISLDGLKRAAANLIAVSPTVYTLATGFIQFVSQLHP